MKNFSKIIFSLNVHWCGTFYYRSIVAAKHAQIIISKNDLSNAWKSFSRQMLCCHIRLLLKKNTYIFFSWEMVPTKMGDTSNGLWHCVLNCRSRENHQISLLQLGCYFTWVEISSPIAKILITYWWKSSEKEKILWALVGGQQKILPYKVIKKI